MLVVIVANLMLTVLAVGIHYEALRRISDWIQRQPHRRRVHLLIGVFAALGAHVLEVWLYGLGIYWLLANPEWGSLVGAAHGGLLDCVYFSLSNYTSLGMGDIQPQGLVRFVAGFEALTGLVLITWTASFLFLEMQRIWQNASD